MDTNHRRTERAVRLLAVAATSLWFMSGCAHPYVRRLEAYRAAKKAKDYDTAAKHLNPNARIWHGSKEGPGHPLRAKGGPYADWDREFRSRSTKEDVRVEGRTLSYLSYETNDYYRLIERQPTKARVTYYFDDDGKIEGMLYAGLNRDTRPPDRRAEFDAWAGEHYPGLIDSEEMEIPNNPKRWRQLLTEWRADVGLPPID